MATDWFSSDKGKCPIPTPRAETCQSSLPNLRYFINFSQLAFSSQYTNF
jgi:hypothetical protein